MSALRLTPSKSHEPDRLAAESRAGRGTKLHGSRMSRATIIRRPKRRRPSAKAIKPYIPKEVPTRVCQGNVQPYTLGA
mgnify:CR=1 FL=1